MSNSKAPRAHARHEQTNARGLRSLESLVEDGLRREVDVTNGGASHYIEVKRIEPGPFFDQGIEDCIGTHPNDEHHRVTFLRQLAKAGIGAENEIIRPCVCAPAPCGGIIEDAVAHYGRQLDTAALNLFAGPTHYAIIFSPIL